MPQPAAPDAIVVRGARTHNLKNIDVSLPMGQLIIVTGVSGSGKSSLAFDTIYAEGQRRYVGSLSAYARQFLERMEKPDVDRIEGICPAIAIRQKNTIRNPRSNPPASRYQPTKWPCGLTPVAIVNCVPGKSIVLKSAPSNKNPRTRPSVPR